MSLSCGSLLASVPATARCPPYGHGSHARGRPDLRRDRRVPGALRNSLIAHDAQWIFALQLPVLPAKERPPIGAAFDR